MASAGVHGISLDSADMGVDLAAAAARIPDHIVVIGNISPATTMRFGTVKEVRREVDGLLREMAPYPNFVLSTGCDLPQETPIDNIRAFMDAGREGSRRT
jgi:uroporphyrinogen decarboxylase